MLKVPDLHNPLLWALLIGWILTVVLHEFAHGLVAYLGGDYTIKERGGLTLNPIQYVDPVMTLILPAVFLMLGGIPLPGGATYIRRDLLRSKLWNSLVSAAGPAMNLLIFALLCVAIHPIVGWITYSDPIDKWSNAQIFTVALAYTQILSAILNLVPIPPLDGFGIIDSYLSPRLRDTVTTYPWNLILFAAYFFALWGSPTLQLALAETMHEIFALLGIPPEPAIRAFYQCLS
jgi:Zn-dependent protease